MIRHQFLFFFFFALFLTFNAGVCRTVGADAGAESSLRDSPLLTEAEGWTLEDSVNRMLAVSPRLRSKEAEAEAHRGEMLQAGAWTNPEVELVMDNKLGKEDGAGRVDLTQIAVSQPVSLGRARRERRQARLRFAAARQKVLLQRLFQEAETARRFHALQLTSARLKQAEAQFAFASRYQKDVPGKDGGNGDHLVRYLNPLEQKRLDIMRASARQLVASAEGEYSEALSGLGSLLQLPEGAYFRTAELAPVAMPGALEVLLKVQAENHPMIEAAKLAEAAAKEGIKLARGELLPDPTLKLFGEKDYLDGGREIFWGAAFQFQFPLWDRKRGAVISAKAEAEKESFDLEAVKQELEAQLKQSYLHLGHLRVQAEQYQSEILGAAQDVFELTRNAFAAGEVNVLSIIDANNLYFDAQKRYLDLLYEASLELAQVRLAAGLTVVEDTVLSGAGGPGGGS